MSLLTDILPRWLRAKPNGEAPPCRYCAIKDPFQRGQLGIWGHDLACPVGVEFYPRQEVASAHGRIRDLERSVDTLQEELTQVKLYLQGQLDAGAPKGTSSSQRRTTGKKLKRVPVQDSGEE